MGEDIDCHTCRGIFSSEKDQPSLPGELTMQPVSFSMKPQNEQKCNWKKHLNRKQGSGFSDQRDLFILTD